MTSEAAALRSPVGAPAAGLTRSSLATKSRSRNRLTSSTVSSPVRNGSSRWRIKRIEKVNR